MEVIVQYFENIPTTHRSAILIGGLTFFFLIESLFPLLAIPYRKWKHAGINLFFTATTVIINLIFATFIVLISSHATTYKWGLMQWLEFSDIAILLIGLPLFDFIGAWLPHFLQHRVRWMWMFHLIHHSDPMVDTTTANRHHPGESVIRVVFTNIAVIVLGSPLWLVMLYQSLSVILSQFNHANISLPQWLDKTLSWFIVSPDMHKVHHHYRLPYTDSNYGNIFSVWDRLFRTFTSLKSTDQLVYGLDTYSDKTEHSRLQKLIVLPFKGYRNPSIQGKDEVEQD